MAERSRRRRELVGDLVVIVPGMLGTRLATSSRTLWDPPAGDLWRGIEVFAAAVDDFHLPRDLGDGPATDGIMPLGLVADVHGLPGIWGAAAGYDDLTDWLLSAFTLTQAVDPDEPGNLVRFAYDWRLSARYNARRLKTVVDEALGRWRDSLILRSGAQVRFICFSTGGLITRYYVECLGGREVTR